MRRIREEDLRGGIVLFLRAKFAYVRDTICVRDVLPLGRQVDMDRAIRKCHVFGNDDLRAAAQVLVDSELFVNIAVFRHRASRACVATDIPRPRGFQFNVIERT